MNCFKQRPAIMGLLSMLVLSLPMPTQAQPKPAIPDGEPNLTLKVIRQSGNCPQEVRLWTAIRQYEGGGEHTVIADTLPIVATAVKLTTSYPQLIEYSAPLKQDFASCLARTNPDADLPYYFRLQQGRLFFRIDLRSINRNPSTPAAITYKAVLTSRPYVRWAIAD
ncbi:hypothetical protein K9N68_32275 [Kovacikia minuta CCNUW1]|uniref:hypothetical protein n=1 Tax=Kovacikia minuta TaxID=2931930 RepID=UPI001CCF8D53|nr:hypothetical protein [Kovacikia minuta]UBF26150.1 hypothetical protein K9N68_32275 [Kovacikia minuta CCNUW1]